MTNSYEDFDVFFGKRPTTTVPSPVIRRLPFPPTTALPRLVFSSTFGNFFATARPLAPNSEEETQLAYAMVNVMCGVVAVILTLMALSVVPDCFGRVRSQFLFFLVTQILHHLVLLIVSTIYIALRLAHDDSSAIIDPSLAAGLGYFAVFCVATSASLQLFSSVQRYISVVWPNLYGRVCTRQISVLITVGSMLFGANTLIGHYTNDRTLNYDINARRWLFSSHFNGNLSNAFIGCACLVLGALFITALTPLLFHSFFSKKHAQFPLARSIRLREARTITFSYAADLLYFVTLAYCNYRAIPPRNAHRSSEFNPNYYDGLIQTYLFGILPTVNAVVNFNAIRKALCFRVKLTADSAPVHGVAVRSNQPSKRRYSAIPMFAGMQHLTADSRHMER